MGEPVRILLPVRPDNDCTEPARILEALFGHDNVSVLRMFVYRAAELDLYDPEVLAAVPAIRRLDEGALREAEESAKVHCRGLAQAGFHVESAIVEGFPIETIMAEAEEWRADMIVAHIAHEISPENRIGRIAGALIDAANVPVLVYREIGPTVGTTIAVHVDFDDQGSCALRWAAALASRSGAAIHAVHTVVAHRWTHQESVSEAHDALRKMTESLGRPVTAHVETAKSIAEGLGRVIEGAGCDLAIVPAHHSFAPSIIGSSDRRIVTQCHVPVVLVPAPDRVDPDVLAKKVAPSIEY